MDKNWMKKALKALKKEKAEKKLVIYDGALPLVHKAEVTIHAVVGRTTIAPGEILEAIGLIYTFDGVEPNMLLKSPKDIPDERFNGEKAVPLSLFEQYFNEAKDEEEYIEH